MTSVLIVLSAADSWTLKDGSKHPTGYWAEELVEPHRIFSAAGWGITIASPGGQKPTVDKASLGFFGGMPRKTRALAAYLAENRDEIDHPKPLAEIEVLDFDAVFYPGGHGPMEDLSHDVESGRIISTAMSVGIPLALLCHAPAAAFAARNEDGTWPFAGYVMTGLSNAEEKFNRLADKAPWLLEDRLIDEGAKYVKGPVPLAPYIAVDRNLYTGQNPASAGKLARRIIADFAEPAMRISVQKKISASPGAVYEVISDVASIGDRSPEAIGATWLRGRRRFIGHNRIGLLYRWSTLCTVTEDKPGTTFEFYASWPSMTTWRYELASVKGGTEVTETMTKAGAQYAPIRWTQNLVGVRDRGAHLRAGMQTTLDRLAAHFDAETGAGSRRQATLPSRDASASPYAAPAPKG